MDDNDKKARATRRKARRAQMAKVEGILDQISEFLGGASVASASKSRRSAEPQLEAEWAMVFASGESGEAGQTGPSFDLTWEDAERLGTAGAALFDFYLLHAKCDSDASIQRAALAKLAPKLVDAWEEFADDVAQGGSVATMSICEMADAQADLYERLRCLVFGQESDPPAVDGA